MSDNKVPENIVPWKTVRAAMKARKRAPIRRQGLAVITELLPAGENRRSGVESSEPRGRLSLLRQFFPASASKSQFHQQQWAIAPCTSGAGSGRTQALIRSWGDKSIPIHGYSQPGNGVDFDLALPQMSKNQNPRKAKPITPPHWLARQRLSENLTALIDIEFPVSKYSTRSAREKAVAKAAGSSWSTIQRILNQQVSPTTDTLVDLASVFGVSPSDLLTPNFSQTYVARNELKRRSG